MSFGQAIKDVAGDAQELGSTGDIGVRQDEGTADRFGFGLIARLGQRRPLGCARRRQPTKAKVGCRQPGPFRHHDGALQNRNQLTYVAGPPIAAQCRDGLGLKALKRAIDFAADLSGKVIGEKHNVIPTVPQRRHFNGKEVETIKQVPRKCPASTAFFTSMWVAATTRASSRIVAVEPARSIIFSCSPGRRWPCSSSGKSPISSRKLVNGAGRTFLSRAAFSGDQSGDVGRRHFADSAAV